VPKHPGLARVIDAGQHGIDPYVVTALALGESLDVALREYGPATIDDAVPRLQRLAEGLDLAASRGVWHGALQPRDVLVAAKDTQIVGLGIAPILERAGVRRPMRRPYSAPELADGAPTSASSDQYALGAIAYEWLFGGRAPRSAESVLDAPALPGVVAERLASALMSALAPDPADRFANCAKFVEAIRSSVIDLKRVPALAVDQPAAPPAPVPLPLEIDQPEPAETALVDEQPLEMAPAQLDFADRDLEVERHSPVLSDSKEIAVEDSPATLQDDEPELTLSTRDAATPRVPREAKPQVAWQGSLGARTQPPSDARRGGFGTLMAALIGLLIGAIGGYLVGIRGSNDGDEAAVVADQVAPATAPGREFTDAPVAAAPAETPATAPAANANAAKPDPKQDRSDARLLVRSSPVGASVTIDGTPRGTTPLTLRELDLGTRTVVISRPGYVPVERRVTLTADRPSRSVEVELTPVAAAPAPARAPRAARGDVTTGSVVVDSRPAGASVTIDGKPSGTTPMTIAALPPGKHTVRLELPGYRPWSQTIDLRAGERRRVGASLEIGQDEE
jgi:hypothetical protein